MPFSISTMFLAISALVKDSSTSSESSTSSLCMLLYIALSSFLLISFILLTIALICIILEGLSSSLRSSSETFFNLGCFSGAASPFCCGSPLTSLVPFSALLIEATALSTGFSSGLTTSPLPLSILAASDEPCLTGFESPFSAFESGCIASSIACSRFFSKSAICFSCLSFSLTLLFIYYKFSTNFFHKFNLVSCNLDDFAVRNSLRICSASFILRIPES